MQINIPIIVPQMHAHTNLKIEYTHLEISI